jgi:ankyrin repeat protein
MQLALRPSIELQTTATSVLQRAAMNSSLIKQSLLSVLCVPSIEQVNIVSALIKEGANVNEQDEAGNTPLVCLLVNGAGLLTRCFHIE